MSDINTKKLNGVILMRGAKLDLYIPSYSTTVFSFQMPSDVYAEMEIKNVDLATKLLVDFFTVNKIPPTEFILILQTPLFRKEFSLAPQEKLEESINLYLDYIPFDSVLSKRIKTDGGVLVVAANGDLIINVNKMFAFVSSSIECTTALEGLTIFPKGGGLSVLTQVSADIILKNIPLIKQESFSLTPQRSVEGFEMVEQEEEKKEKSTLPYIIPIFVILLAILGYVYVKSNVPTPVTPKTQPTPTSAISQTQNTTLPTIKLTTARSLTDTLEKIKAQLIAAGFTSIVEDGTSDVISPKSFVTYSSSVSASVKATIQTILKKIIPTITEEPVRESSYDIMIVIGK